MLFETTEHKQKEEAMKQAGRPLPGQSLTLKWPILQHGIGAGHQSHKVGLPRLSGRDRQPN